MDWIELGIGRQISNSDRRLLKDNTKEFAPAIGNYFGDDGVWHQDTENRTMSDCGFAARVIHQAIDNKYHSGAQGA